MRSLAVGWVLGGCRAAPSVDPVAWSGRVLGADALLLQPRLFASDEARRDAPERVQRLRIAEVAQQVIRHDDVRFPADGIMLQARDADGFAAGDHYAIVDGLGLLAEAVVSEHRCPPSPMPCALPRRDAVFARLDRERLPRRLGVETIAVGPLDAPAPQARVLGDAERSLAEGPYRRGDPGHDEVLVDLDGDALADVATTVRGYADARRPCDGVEETVVRDGDTWFATRWRPRCAPRQSPPSWSAWAWPSAPQPSHASFLPASPELGARVWLLDRSGRVAELEVVDGPVVWSSHAGAPVHLATIGPAHRRVGADAVIVGPIEGEAPHARVLATPEPHVMVRGSGRATVVSAIDLDGDGRADLELRMRSCVDSRVDGTSDVVCREVVRIEGGGETVLVRERAP